MADEPVVDPAVPAAPAADPAVPAEPVVDPVVPAEPVVDPVVPQAEPGPAPAASPLAERRLREPDAKDE